MDVDVPGFDHGLGDTLEDGLMGDAVQRDGAGERPRVRLVAAEHGVEQVDNSQIGEPRYAMSASSWAVLVTSRVVPM